MKCLKILALVAMVALVANVAFAGLIVDLRAVSATGTTTIVDSHKIQAGGVGDVVKFELYAYVEGYTSAATLTSLQGNIKETVPAFAEGAYSAKGTMSIGANVTEVYGSVFNTGFLPGLVTNPTTGDIDFSNSNAQWNPKATSAQNATTALYIGTFNYTLNAVPKGANETTIAFVPKASGPGASWTLDGVTKNGTNGYTALSPITITAVPEPGTLILLGMGALALVFIRRRK